MRKLLLLGSTLFLLAGAVPAVAHDRPPGNDNGPPGCEPSNQQPKKCDCPPVEHSKLHGVQRTGDRCPQPPEPPCATPKGADGSSMCCDSDNDQDDAGCSVTPPPTPTPPITVVPEPPGSNCTAGGIKITVNSTPVEVFFICNGVPGVIGPTGPQGPPGPPGPQGPAGTPPTITVVQGPGPNQITITINGVPTVITIPVGVNPAPCVNTKRTALLGPLPTRFKNGLTVTTRVNGSTQNGRVQDHKVRVRLPKACGPVALVVNDRPNTRAIVPVLRIWLLEGGNRIVRVGFPLPVPPLGLS